MLDHPSPQSAAQAAPDPGKISDAVQADLAQDGKATFWVRLKGEADLSGARRAVTKDEKAARVYEAKTESADALAGGLADVARIP